MPPEKFNIREIDTFFSNFGEVVRTELHCEKMCATIKFKDIESAEKASHYVNVAHNPIWGNPNVKLIYNTQG